MKISQILNFGYNTIISKLLPNYKKPLSVYFFLTYRCPFKCKYCNILNSLTDTVKELSINEIKTLIQQMAASGVKKIQLTGGEALIHKDINEIISEIKKYNIFLGISTSGYNIESIKDRLSNVDIFFLSYDGPEKIVKKIRGEKAYSTVIKAAEFLNHNNQKFWTTSVIHKLNCEYIPDILKFAGENKTYANFQIIHPRNENYLSSFADRTEADNYYMTEDEFRRPLRELINLKKSGAPIGTSLKYFNFLLNWPDYKVSFTHEKKYSCYAGRLYCYLEPDGMLYPCATHMGNMQGFSALNSGFYNAFKKLQKPVCTACLSSCQMEQNFIFSLSVENIFNWLTKI